MENINTKARTDEKLGDLKYYLSQYSFKIKYNLGKSHQESDCFIRNPVLNRFENTNDIFKIINLINFENIKSDQSTNQDVQNDINKLILEGGPHKLLSLRKNTDDK